MNRLTFGLDIAKSVFHCVSMDQHGHIKQRKKLSRSKVLGFFANVPKAIVVMEACGSANYWAREIEALGHEAKLLAPQHAIAYRRKCKNDYNDAQAIAEASQRHTMTFAMIKTPEQQEIQALLKIRDSLVASQIAIANQIRGQLAEFGLTLNQGQKAIREQVPDYLEDAENGLPDRLRRALYMLYLRYLQTDQEITQFNKEIQDFTQTHPICRRAQTVPGIGPIIAATLFASIGNGVAFKNGRQFAAWCGLVPKQHSTGGKNQLGGITKRGNAFLRKLLVHGARSVMNWVERKEKKDALSLWALNLKMRKHTNTAVVALANKLARIVWSVIAKDENYQFKANA